MGEGWVLWFDERRACKRKHDADMERGFVFYRMREPPKSLRLWLYPRR